MWNTNTRSEYNEWNYSYVLGFEDNKYVRKSKQIKIILKMPS